MNESLQNLNKIIKNQSIERKGLNENSRIQQIVINLWLAWFYFGRFLFYKLYRIIIIWRNQNILTMSCILKCLLEKKNSPLKVFENTKVTWTLNFDEAVGLAHQIASNFKSNRKMSNKKKRVNNEKATKEILSQKDNYFTRK